MMRRSPRPFTLAEDQRMIALRLGDPGYSGIRRIAAALDRRPTTVFNRLGLLARRDPALREQLAVVSSRPRVQPDVHPTIAALHAKRKDLRMTRPQLADIVGYSKSSLENWEMGRRFPTVQALLDWAQALGMSLETVEVRHAASR